MWQPMPPRGIATSVTSRFAKRMIVPNANQFPLQVNCECAAERIAVLDILAFAGTIPVTSPLGIPVRGVIPDSETTAPKELTLHYTANVAHAVNPPCRYCIMRRAEHDGIEVCPPPLDADT